MTERRQDPERTQLFIVRLWPESFDRGQRVWRGEVMHTSTDGRRYFARWEDMLAFLCRAVGVSWEGHIDREITTEVVDRE
jgi:hypothetical protein